MFTKSACHLKFIFLSKSASALVLSYGLISFAGYNGQNFPGEMWKQIFCLYVIVTFQLLKTFW